MIFDSRISGIPCQIKVGTYIPYVPMKVYGTGYGDADAPVPPEIEFEVLDRKGYKASWLEKKLTPDDEARLLEEFQLMRLGERYGQL